MVNGGFAAGRNVGVSAVRRDSARDPSSVPARSLKEFIADGYVGPSDGAGLGVEVDEALFATMPGIAGRWLYLKR